MSKRLQQDLLLTSALLVIGVAGIYASYYRLPLLPGSRDSAAWQETLHCFGSQKMKSLVESAQLYL
jgi:hypothetical protein